jgi:hypothetical protein
MLQPTNRTSLVNEVNPYPQILSGFAYGQPLPCVTGRAVFRLRAHGSFRQGAHYNAKRAVLQEPSARCLKCLASRSGDCSNTGDTDWPRPESHVSAARILSRIGRQDRIETLRHSSNRASISLISGRVNLVVDFLLLKGRFLQCCAPTQSLAHSTKRRKGVRVLKANLVIHRFALFHHLLDMPDREHVLVNDALSVVSRVHLMNADIVRQVAHLGLDTLQLLRKRHQWFVGPDICEVRLNGRMNEDAAAFAAALFGAIGVDHGSAGEERFRDRLGACVLNRVLEGILSTTTQAHSHGHFHLDELLHQIDGNPYGSQRG